MCINKEVSITTFISSWIVAIYIWFRNHKYDKWFSLFLLTFSSIQFWEFLLWTLQEKNLLGSSYDFAISKVIIPITLCLELIVPYIGKLWYQNNYKWNIGKLLLKQLKSNIYPYLLIIYLICFIIKMAKQKRQTIVSKQGSLQWGESFQTKKISFINGLIFAFFLAMPFISTTLCIPIFLFVSVIFSLIISDSFGSYWCLIANFSTFFFLMYPYF